MKFGTGIAEYGYWFSKYLSHSHFQVMPLLIFCDYKTLVYIVTIYHFKKASDYATRDMIGFSLTVKVSNSIEQPNAMHISSKYVPSFLSLRYSC